MVVGKGMLDAACPGDVFAAPPMDYVLETSKLLASPKGVLHIVNNYTGDRMAFEMGQEMAEADGITIGTLIVDDDVAVKDSTYTVGRRGVAGNFFVIKATGAASEQGAGLDELLRIGNKVNSVTRTMGMALTSVHAAGQGLPAVRARRRRDGDGRRIDGEPGRRREKLASANAIVDELLEAGAAARSRFCLSARSSASWRVRRGGCWGHAIPIPKKNAKSISGSFLGIISSSHGTRGPQKPHGNLRMRLLNLRVVFSKPLIFREHATIGADPDLGPLSIFAKCRLVGNFLSPCDFLNFCDLAARGGLLDGRPRSGRDAAQRHFFFHFNDRPRGIHGHVFAATVHCHLDFVDRSAVFDFRRKAPDSGPFALFLNSSLHSRRQVFHLNWLVRGKGIGKYNRQYDGA